ncbi:MAG: DUF2254 domain-containing protein [Bacteroidetes bacterium]|nr:DUF2254 domain-containing protein [Bacteroidota bacterium]
MTWLQQYKIISYIRGSIWILPSLSIFVAMACVRTLNWIEIREGWITGFDAATTMTVLGTLAASMFTLVVFVCSALLISVQLASASLTPRFIGLVFQNPVIRYSLTIFMFTFTFSLGALLRIKESVPLLTAYTAVYGCIVSLITFIFLVDKVGKALRPSGALALAAKRGHDVIENVYPRLLAGSQVPGPEHLTLPDRKPSGTILNPKGGVVLAFDVEGLVSIARQSDCIIELVPQVGDFIAAGQPLFRIFGSGAVPPARLLFHSVSVGPERTFRQDPGFAFRILVDIASKGLSPAINDPTTAVLAIDQIQYLLHFLGGRYLDEGQRADANGKVRLIYRTPDWEDFIRLAVTEVRQFGGTSIQIARRLKAMLESLMQTLPAERSEILRTELDLIGKSARRFFPEEEDLAMAGVSDFQGVGGRKAAGVVK